MTDETEPTVVEAEGETVGEAKWLAVRELERLHPQLDRTSIEFEVVSEGERGLLGVGTAPARVLARLDPAGVGAAPAPALAVAQRARQGSDLARTVDELVRAIVDGIGARCEVEVHEDSDEVHAAIAGPDVGLLIGRNGQTIEAIQQLVATVGQRIDRDRSVVIDAADYRDRRRARLEALAARAAQQVRATGRPVTLEPMTAADRKIVHTRLQDVSGIVTASEGEEPDRCVVVSPA